MGLPIMQWCRMVAGSAILSAVGGLFYAARAETRSYRLEVVHVTADMLRQCGKSIAGGERSLRILHLSDLHLRHPESEKVEFLKRITDADYDLVLLTGDIFENHAALPYAQALLSRQPALGAFAVLGNHDYYDYKLMHKTVGRIFRRLREPPAQRDVEPMIRALRKVGFEVLRNSAVNLPGPGIHVVGIDYPTIEPDKFYELVGRKRDKDLVVAIFHLPVRLDLFSGAGVHLAIGGHTHGGQVCLPGGGAIFTDSELPRGTASGLFFHGKTLFHISRGIGADPRTNIRLFCPPAATIIEVARD